MRKALGASLAVLAVLVLSAASTQAAVRGNYVEVRSADVYTGPCFANSEVSLTGDQAILAWKVSDGAWNGVSLNGLGVVAVVKASATLGDPYHSAYPAKAVLIVDERATPEQRAALRQFAQSAGGKLLANIVRVEAAPINMQVGEGNEHGSVKLVAGDFARIETRSLCAGDHLCGNEEVYYPPLTRLAHAMPAYTLREKFSGKGLGVSWDRMDARSAFIGTFSL